MSLFARVRQALPQPRITIARWIALTTLTAMLFLLLLKGLFSLLLSVWAQPPLLESGVIEKVAAVTRILDAAPMAQRVNIAIAAGDDSYSVRWLRRHDEAGVPALVDAEFREGTPILRALPKRPDARVESFEPSDMPVVRRVVSQAAADGFRLRSIIMGIVEGAPFQMRTTLEPAETVNTVARASVELP